MKNLNTLILALFLLISLHFSCKKSNMPNLVDNQSISDEIIMQQLISRLGSYHVICRIRTGTFTIDSTGLGPIEVLIDSFSLDTMILSIAENMISDDHSNQFIDKNTIFVSTEHKRHKHTDLFYIYLNNSKIKFGYPRDGYSCKCSGGLRFENDSIFYRNYRMTSFENHLVCSGTKIN